MRRHHQPGAQQKTPKTKSRDQPSVSYASCLSPPPFSSPLSTQEPPGPDAAGQHGVDADPPLARHPRAGAGALVCRAGLQRDFGPGHHQTATHPRLLISACRGEGEERTQPIFELMRMSSIWRMGWYYIVVRRAGGGDISDAKRGSALLHVAECVYRTGHTAVGTLMMIGRCE